MGKKIDGVFWIFTPMMNERGKHIGFPFKPLKASLTTIAELTHALATDGIVAGQILFFDEMAFGGDKVLRRTKDIALTVKGIASIEMPIFRAFEKDAATEEPAALANGASEVAAHG